MVAGELKDTEYGIICVTPYNVFKPWLNFEAGALSKCIDRSCVSPLLFNVGYSEIQGPLAQFQATVWSEDGIYNLVSSINDRLAPQEQLDHARLRRTFNAWWGELQKAVDAITDTRESETRTAYEWLYTLDDIEIREDKTDYTSVWFIVTDMCKYALKQNVKDRIQKKLKNGVTYRFFVRNPSDNDKINDLNELLVMAKSSQKGIEVKTFNEESFNNQAATDYIIMNANPDGHPLQVFLRLPVVQDPHEYWIRVDDESAQHFVGRFKNMWDPHEVTKG